VVELLSRRLSFVNADVMMMMTIQKEANREGFKRDLGLLSRLNSR
jgi:hypothetical protein